MPAFQAGVAAGPLKIHPTNPRYFADGSGRAVYLTGSHTWASLQDRGTGDPPLPFDFNRYLDFLQRHNHNFFRLWVWSLSTFSYRPGRLSYCAPFPWLRAGPGTALDGHLKFDLSQFDQTYFDRLRARCLAAGERGIYVAVMLFEGHALHASRTPWCWDGHPFHVSNNVNGIDGNPDRSERGLKIQTLEIPAVLAVQEAYVRKVIDATGDLDNVLYEIANESGNYSTAWQYHLIDYIHAYEKDRPKQHPVGMTFQWTGDPATRGTNRDLWDSPADWISPSIEDGYRDDPPAADGRKVIINDTDHLGGISGDQAWVWKSFCRGLHPIFMDPYVNPYGLGETDMRPPLIMNGYWKEHIPEAPEFEPPWTPIRRNMGYTLDYANRMNLACLTPHGELASTRYCLADPGKEYLVYIPSGGEVTLDLTQAEGELGVEWLDPSFAERHRADNVAGGASRHFIAPCSGDAVLYVAKKLT